MAGLFIEGEISNFTAHRSGHCYFSLKDSGGSLSTVMFNSHASGLKFTPKNGMKVIAFGRLSLYEKTGQFQLYVEFLEPSGIGGLHLAFTQLCEKLKTEGLFDEARKRPLPAVARCVAVITSPTGAAVRDIITTAKKRDPSVRLVIVPALVQGEAAAVDIVRAINDVNVWGAADLKVRSTSDINTRGTADASNRSMVDVIILGRGGGNAEDLQAFNDEAVARAIAASAIPVISAVGHETDITVSDFVADVRAATPTAAAQLAVADIRGVQVALRNLTAGLHHAMRTGILKRYNQTKNLLHTLSRLTRTRLAHEQQTLAHREALLEKISPYAAFARGLAFVKNEKNEAVTASDMIKTGDLLTLHWGDGSVRAQVL